VLTKASGVIPPNPAIKLLRTPTIPVKVGGFDLE